MLRYLLAVAAVAVSVAGHGRVLEPPSRASMWRSGFPTEPNYDDDGVNCGGFTRQHGINGGKCGVCGDPYDVKEPRPHELGGLFGQGIIVDKYEEGQVFNATVDISAYHKGHWNFKICPDPNNNNQSCFDEYPVELEEGGTKFYPPHGGVFTVSYRLPKGLVCDHCVLQWRYVAGNNWDTCKDGSSKAGCGKQETFGACSDISISPRKPLVDDVVPIVVISDENDTIDEEKSEKKNMQREFVVYPISWNTVYIHDIFGDYYRYYRTLQTINYLHKYEYNWLRYISNLYSERWASN